MIDPVVILPLFIMGLVSSAHCIGMCGGIMGALTMAIPPDAKRSRWLILVAYNIGRISSYVLMGALAGLFAEQFAALGGGIILRVLAGILLIAMGLYLADWWRGLTKLEVVGRYLWVYIQPIGKRLVPVTNMPKALLLGGLWGWLPCGLVYSALAMAMTQPAAGAASAAMLAFGIGTLPAVLVAGVAAQQLTRVLQKPGLRAGLALLMVAFGLWTIWGSLGHSHAHHDASSNTHPALDHRHHSDALSDHSSTHHKAVDQSDHDESDHTTGQSMAPGASTSERQRTDLHNATVEDKSSVPYSSASSIAKEEVEHHHH